MSAATSSGIIEKTPGVCGGDACIRATRIPVRLLVEMRQHGAKDEQILEDFPESLTPADLLAAWQYYADHPEEIEEAIRLNSEARG